MKKIILLFIFALLAPVFAFSQKDSSKSDSAKYEKMIGNLDTGLVKFNMMEQPPQFKGGMKGFGEFLRDNMVYPKEAKRKGTSGKVILSFIVEKDGSITDVTVLQGIGDGCDEVAVEALKKSPKWLPGIQDGRPVRVKYNIPLSFGLRKT